MFFFFNKSTCIKCLLTALLYQKTLVILLLLLLLYFSSRVQTFQVGTSEHWDFPPHWIILLQVLVKFNNKKYLFPMVSSFTEYISLTGATSTAFAVKLILFLHFWDNLMVYQFSTKIYCPINISQYNFFYQF